MKRLAALRARHRRALGPEPKLFLTPFDGVKKLPPASGRGCDQQDQQPEHQDLTTTGLTVCDPFAGV